MGFFDRFRKREEPAKIEPEPQEPEKINISGISEWLDKSFAGKTALAKQKSSELQKGISSGFAEL